MAILKNWQEEKRSAYLYQKVAKRETDATHQKLFLDLAEGAEKQAKIWEEKLKETGKGQHTFVYKPDFRTRLVSELVTLFGSKSIRFILSAMKVRGMSIYSAPQASARTATAHLETRHKGLNTAGNFRAAVFGVNDGLVSNMSLLLGVVGANADQHFILLSGIAGLLAGACSMAAGEYISMRSQREFFEYQIALEKEELELYPEEEASELAVIYRARGVPIDEAKKMANLIISDPNRALDTLAREELGLNPSDLGSPFGAAAASFVSFAGGALIPLLPFFVGTEKISVYYSIGFTGFALFFIGGLLSLFTNRSALLSGLRMLLIGGFAGALTFLIGKMASVMF